MSNQNMKFKKPEIKKGTVVEIFACGGQCRGKNSSLLNYVTTDVKSATKKEKVS